ncbi:MAG: 2'-5' RNA ligase family protein [Candidatus Korobacteraceae bacterium]|jgi:2'-5' RNA ligase
MSRDCSPVQYALVAYIKNELGEFVEELRRQLHPVHAHLPTHLTVLPPRPLQGSEEDAVAMLRQFAATVAPFQVELGEVESFLPVTPTVFIRVSYAGYRMRELHDLLNRDPLAFSETLPYMPHVTIAKLDNDVQAEEVLRTSKMRWKEYQGSHHIPVERMTFVRGSQHTWADLAEIDLSSLPR